MELRSNQRCCRILLLLFVPLLRVTIFCNVLGVDVIKRRDPDKLIKNPACPMPDLSERMKSLGIHFLFLAYDEYEVVQREKVVFFICQRTRRSFVNLLSTCGLPSFIIMLSSILTPNLFSMYIPGSIVTTMFDLSSSSFFILSQGGS